MKKLLTLLILLVFSTEAWADLTGTEGLAIDLSSAGAGTDFTIAFDPTELLGSRTWGDGSTDTIVWTWNRATGTDPTITFGNGSIALQALTLTTDLAVTEGGTGASNLNAFLLTATYDVAVDGFVDGNDTAYASSWNGKINAPSMNAVYDKIATLGVGDMTKAVYDVAIDGFVDGNDTAYAASWNGKINAPSMNAIYDKIQALGGGGDMTKAVYDVAEDGFVDGNDTTYAASWNGNVNAATMNAIYDKIETIAETDPCLALLDINSTDVTNWGTAFGWGDHSGEGYLTAEVDPCLALLDINSTDVTNWGTAYGWGDHGAAGYESETHASEHAVGAADTIFPADPNADKFLQWDDDPGVLVWASPAGSGDMTRAVYDVAEDGFVDGNDTAYAASWDTNPNAPSMNVLYDEMELLLDAEVDPCLALLDINSTDVTNWGTAFGWGDHSLEGYLTAYAETDPCLALLDINSTDVTNWGTAFGWGDHSLEGYLTAYAETDPCLALLDINSTDVTAWNTAYGWGDHSLAGYITADPNSHNAATVLDSQSINLTLSGQQITADVNDKDYGDVVVSGTGAVWAVDNDSHAHTSSTISGLDISADTNLTAGDHITLTDDDLDIDDDFLHNTGDSGTGAYNFGGADSLEIPNSADPDLTVLGQISIDTDGANETNDVTLRTMDAGGDIQYALAQVVKTFQATIIKPNDLADATRDLCPIWSNESGMIFTVTKIEAWSSTDNTTLTVKVRDSVGAGAATVDAVEIASDGTGMYYTTETTITAATIAANYLMYIDFDDTDDPGWVKISISGYFNADVN